MALQFRPRSAASAGILITYLEYFNVVEGNLTQEVVKRKWSTLKDIVIFQGQKSYVLKAVYMRHSFQKELLYLFRQTSVFTVHRRTKF